MQNLAASPQEVQGWLQRLAAAVARWPVLTAVLHGCAKIPKILRPAPGTFTGLEVTWKWHRHNPGTFDVSVCPQSHRGLSLSRVSRCTSALAVICALAASSPRLSCSIKAALADLVVQVGRSASRQAEPRCFEAVLTQPSKLKSFSVTPSQKACAACGQVLIERRDKLDKQRNFLLEPWVLIDFMAAARGCSGSWGLEDSYREVSSISFGTSEPQA